jgi:hypothetical protein
VPGLYLASCRSKQPASCRRRRCTPQRKRWRSARSTACGRRRKVQRRRPTARRSSSRSRTRAALPSAPRHRTRWRAQRRGRPRPPWSAALLRRSSNHAARSTNMRSRVLRREQAASAAALSVIVRRAVPRPARQHQRRHSRGPRMRGSTSPHSGQAMRTWPRGPPGRPAAAGARRRLLRRRRPPRRRPMVLDALQPHAQMLPSQSRRRVAGMVPWSRHRAAAARRESRSSRGAPRAAHAPVRTTPARRPYSARGARQRRAAFEAAARKAGRRIAEQCWPPWRPAWRQGPCPPSCASTWALPRRACSAGARLQP